MSDNFVCYFANAFLIAPKETIELVVVDRRKCPTLDRLARHFV
jgi:hypothetical protein